MQPSPPPLQVTHSQLTPKQVCSKKSEVGRGLDLLPLEPPHHKESINLSECQNKRKYLHRLLISLPTVFNTWKGMLQVIVVINHMPEVKNVGFGVGEHLPHHIPPPAFQHQTTSLQPSIKRAPPFAIIFIM